MAERPRRQKSRRVEHVCSACGGAIGQCEPYYYALLDCLLYHVHVGCWGRFTEAKRAELDRLLTFLSAFVLIEAA